jgi:large subunit ribosomal protein L10
MAITKEKKATLLTKMADAVKTASGVFVAFKGLTVSEVNDLRATLKNDGVKYTVVKKTLLKKALSEKGVAGEMPELPGEIAFAYLATGEDITAPARGVHGSIKKLAGKIALVGGLLENKYLSEVETKNIATIPPIPVLRGMFANVINSPIQRLAIGLNEVAKTKA